MIFNNDAASWAQRSSKKDKENPYHELTLRENRKGRPHEPPRRTAIPIDKAVTDLKWRDHKRTLVYNVRDRGSAGSRFVSQDRELKESRYPAEIRVDGEQSTELATRARARGAKERWIRDNTDTRLIPDIPDRQHDDDATGRTMLESELWLPQTAEGLGVRGDE